MENSGFVKWRTVLLQENVRLRIFGLANTLLRKEGSEGNMKGHTFREMYNS